MLIKTNEKNIKKKKSVRLEISKSDGLNRILLLYIWFHVLVEPTVIAFLFAITHILCQ